MNCENLSQILISWVAKCLQKLSKYENEQFYSLLMQIAKIEDWSSATTTVGCNSLKKIGEGHNFFFYKPQGGYEGVK